MVTVLPMLPVPSRGARLVTHPGAQRAQRAAGAHPCAGCLAMPPPPSPLSQWIEWLTSLQRWCHWRGFCWHSCCVLLCQEVKQLVRAGSGTGKQRQRPGIDAEDLFRLAKRSSTQAHEIFDCPVLGDLATTKAHCGCCSTTKGGIAQRAQHRSRYWSDLSCVEERLEALSAYLERMRRCRQHSCGL